MSAGDGGEVPGELQLPSVTRTRDGAMRRVGVELEMGGLEVGRVAELVAGQVAGTLTRLTSVEYRVEGGAHGDWVVELDFSFLKERERRLAEKPAAGELESVAQDLLRRGAEQIVPVEVVCPPVPMDRLWEVEELVATLRRAGARGTTDGVLFAFGMQLNVEVPDTRASNITAYLQAFLCLYDWLLERSRVDVSRRVTAYVDPFPRDYVRRCVDPGYRPDIGTLIDHYLASNPTRNRALDLLPLMLHVDESRVRRVTRDPRIKARPALHYRLPNCEIDREDWGIHEAWTDWLQVEHLVADPGRLADLCASYAAFLDRPLSQLLESWTESLQPWLTQRHHP